MVAIHIEISQFSLSEESCPRLEELFNHILEHHDEFDERCADGFNARLDDFDLCVFCFATFLSTRIYFLQYYRTKHWMYNAV